MKLLIDKEKLEARIAELEQQEQDWLKLAEKELAQTYRIRAHDLKSILQQGEEYNENEAIEFFLFVNKNYKYYNHDKYTNVFNDGSHGKSHISWTFYTIEELLKLYKDARNTKK